MVQSKKEINEMNNEQNAIRKIREGYEEKKVSKFDELKALNKKVINPARVFAYTFGTIGSLVLGTGMCFAMQVIGKALSFGMPLGIGVGIIGILMVSINYPLYKKILASRRRKYKDQVLTLSDELLNK